MRNGMRVKIEAIHEGSHPDMPIVDILTADGEIAQFEVSRRAIGRSRIGIGWPVGRRQDGALLIEIATQYGCLSFGSAFGSHRVWVLPSRLVRSDGAEVVDAQRS